ncbi:NAD(P)-binding protein [Conidiobolus coronatus NRRL 28638]|uniref:NAD(P)-binding protein n=1 Tax=Conidiobolus coronatus (strain ATCC 28846 / CBS 209.66 / NRRL 28638) TaxID=796925 RepID=A0A137P1U5_CONC2|nr:NAD(P)-binding protein [Conidiobolus coronatus NRRL 28638]|eukprot:KXN68854.1 NAD(P)-binding protein [Conidiobolus coronatus NRRL 28638]
MSFNAVLAIIKDVVSHLQPLNIQYFDLTGKTALVTGANSGIGFYTALLLAKMSCNVIIASSNLNKSLKACETLKQLSGNPEISAMHLNLASFNSIDKFIEDFTSKFDKVDIIINNSGVAMDKFTLTENNFETTLQVNYLGPFYMTLKLLPLVEKAKDARIVNVSSFMHKIFTFETPFNFNIANSKNYSLYKEYARTKLYNVLFTRALSIKLRPKKITVVSCHPGLVSTNLDVNMRQGSSSDRFQSSVIGYITDIIGRKGEQCGMTSVFAATSDRVVSGGYYDACVLDFTSKMGKDVKLANQLFDYTLEELKLNFDS